MVASYRGLAGTVIDGLYRDSALSRELSYPVFARGCYMCTGKDRVQMVGLQVRVALGQVRVGSGDIGDGDAVVVVSRERESEVLETVRFIEEATERIREQIARGVRLDEARQQLGYHNLQTHDFGPATVGAVERK
jgi:4-hydroxy-4-methyl-2-oxoglutarate aldolase